MDNIEAATLFLSSGGGETSRSYASMTTGLATSDSDDGYVMVDMGGKTVSDSKSQSVRMPTTVSVRSGDRVEISLNGIDGKAQAPTVIGVIGGGDRTVADYSAKANEACQQAIIAAYEADEVINVNVTAAENAANEAKSLAHATNMHFYHDDSGAHVTQTDADGNETGNSIFNALGMLIRKAANVIAQFTSSAVAFYDGSGTAAGNVTAQFTPTSAQIGKTSAKNIVIGTGGIVMSDNGKYISQHTASSVSFYDGSGNAAGNVTAQFGSTAARIGKTSSNYVYIDSSSVSIMSGSTAKAKFESGKIVLNGETTGLTITGDSLSTYIIGNNAQGLTMRHNYNGSMKSQVVLGNSGFEFDGVINDTSVMFRITTDGTNPIIYVQVSGVASGQATLAKFAAMLNSL